MSTSSNVFNRLSFNFDANKFGDANQLSNATIGFLNSQPIELKDWQKSDLANTNTINVATNYFKNPVINVANSLKSNISNIITVMSTIISYDDASVPYTELLANASNLIIEIDLFNSHTNNVSGVSESANSDYNFPDYEKAISLGRDLLMVLNATDSIQNATPVLGNMTSLFVEEEITSNNTIIATDYNTVNNSIRLVGPNKVSNITSAAANTILSNIITANTLIGGRREHDWNFYNQGLAIMDDFNKINKLEDVGSTQSYLIENLIGTDEYVQKISANN